MARDFVGGQLPLEESTRQTPPGWRPGISKYSVKKYLQKLSLWWRTKNVDDESVAALLVLQRLQGGALKQALRFKVNRDGVEYTGENAFALQRQAGDPAVGVTERPSGVWVVLKCLGETCGLRVGGQQTYTYTENGL